VKFTARPLYTRRKPPSSGIDKKLHGFGASLCAVEKRVEKIHVIQRRTLQVS
jgi:hypothetical protein